jgi:hypothetical protein
MPEGQGRVSLSAQVMGSVKYTQPLITASYKGPSISAIHPLNGTSAGGDLITIYGDNFGVDLNTTWASLQRKFQRKEYQQARNESSDNLVLIGGKQCTVVQVRVLCVVGRQCARVHVHVRLLSSWIERAYVDAAPCYLYCSGPPRESRA